MASPITERLQCMEVWGGNHPVDVGVAMAGLDAWVYSKPFGGATGGGDVHYVSSCATGRITRLLLADVAGHGDQVAGQAVELRTLMRQYVNYLDQTKFVRELNAKIAHWVEQGRFATALASTFFAPTNTLTVCNAGHPAPLWRRAKTGKWSYLEPKGGRAGAEEEGNTPLGLDASARFVQFGVKLAVGDLVLCYTDCLTEARDQDGKLLGLEGLKRLVNEVDAEDPSQFVTQLMARLSPLDARNLQEDDVTLLLFRPNGLFPDAPFTEKLKAPLRLLGGLVESLQPGGEKMPWPEWSVPTIGGGLWGRLNRRWGREFEDREG